MASRIERVCLDGLLGEQQVGPGEPATEYRGDSEFGWCAVAEPDPGSVADLPVEYIGQSRIDRDCAADQVAERPLIGLVVQSSSWTGNRGAVDAVRRHGLETCSGRHVDACGEGSSNSLDAVDRADPLDNSRSGRRARQRST
jgi:hypothetical protein